MRRATVTLNLPDGTEAPVGPGGLVGRMPTCAARIDDPRISEAHALVSLRGRSLTLLALRGALAVGGRRVPDVVLTPGLEIALARDVTITVGAVELPGEVLAVAGVAEAPVELSAPVYSLMPGPKLEPGFRAGALAHLWSDGQDWQVREPGGDARSLEVGDRWTVDGREVTVGAQPLAAVPATIAGGRIDPPLHIIARFETVHVHPRGRAPFVISGIRARIVSELVAYAVPVAWESVAGTLWPDSPRRVQRQNWDRHLKALRALLREAGVRSDLVRADGRGNVELFLAPDDLVVDEG